MNDLYIKAFKYLARARRERISSYVKHRGEKGRLNEQIVSDLLRDISPTRFALGTGFIINSQGSTSTQCDIVIYDEFYNRPLFGDATANIYPIECVYGFVEVKTTLTWAEIDKTLKNIRDIRHMAKQGKYYKQQKMKMKRDENTGLFFNAAVDEEFTMLLPPRSFIFAFDSDVDADIDKFVSTLDQKCDEEHKHFHGLLILERNLFVRRNPYDKPAKFKIDTADGFRVFLQAFLNELRTLPITTMNIDRYLGGTTASG